MIIYRSNRTEVLISELGALLADSRLDPFTKETLVVQGRGMERWLSMQLADRLGIWANPEILSPRGLLNVVFKRVLGDEIDPAFDPESLMWSVADLLPGLLEQQGFEAIARYLDADADGRKRIQLSYQIADTFYQYLTYRPEMIVAWQDLERSEFSDPDERWQATLWRALIERLGTNHLVGRAAEFLHRLERGSFVAGCLSPRVSIFGVSSLPRLYLDLFRGLSRHLELHLFILTPSREYWADTATPYESRRELRLRPERDAASLHLDRSHPLLASLGQLGRDFQRMLEDDDSYEERAGDLYRDSVVEYPTMLGVVQSDILKLCVRGDEGTPRLPLDADDRSIRIHSCHGPMREVEVLREELLACFEADPTLEPQDVVVMAPDIETYSPYIEAIFGVHSRDADAVARGEGSIPCRIADRGPLRGDSVVDAFRRGLDFALGRFAAAEALDLLGMECVSRRFGFEARDLEIVKAWITESGIRWGVDASHRRALDQPGTAENTWRFGLDRLLLGYGVA
ncbi:MAG: exodeoxyribonuclease V subunit gamma, partial [bacterium]|nr:exodeoxyribonuclease V subunit gamma [bacterium]